MSLNVGTLTATLKLEDGQFTAGVNQAKTSMASVDTSAAKASKSTAAMGAAGAAAGKQTADGARQATAQTAALTGAMGKAKQAAGMLGIGLGAAGAVKFFTNAVQDARALGAQTNQMNAIFGESKAGIEAWGATASKELFISQRAAQDAAIQFATFGQAAGKSGEPLAEFSKEMTHLAVETASFQGSDVQEVIDSMGSAFQGQAIPMRKYGVLLSDTALRQVALREGIIDTNRVLSGSEKIQATEIALKEQLVHVNGDIANSNGKLGQNLKGLSARYEEVSAAIGAKLTPIVNSFVQLLSGPGLTALSATGDVIGTLASGVGLLATAFGNLPGPIQAIIGGMVAMRLASTTLGTALTGRVVGGLRGVQGSLRGMSDSVRLHGMYAMDGLRNSFTTATTTATRFGAVGRVVQGSMNAMSAGARGLMGVMGGPWGLALAAATFGLMKYMEQSAKAKEHQKSLATASTTVAEELQKSGGKFTEQGEKAAQAALETIKLADGSDTLKGALDGTGVSSAEAARGLAGVGDAADATKAQLAAMHEEQASQLSLMDKAKQSYTELGSIMGGNLAGIPALFGKDDTEYDTEASLTAEAYGAALEQIAEKRREITSSFESGEVGANFEINANSHELSVMTDAMETFADATTGAADKVGALSKALDTLNGDNLTLENAQQSLNDAVRDLAGEFETARGAAAEAGVEFLTASGTIDTTTKAGSKLHDSMQDVSSAMGEVGAATYENEFANGNYAGALDQTRASVEAAYHAELDRAESLGMTREEYAKVLEQYGATPDQIMTRLDIVNAEGAAMLIAAFGDQVESVPDEKSVIVKTLTDDARANLETLGFKIEELPDNKGFRVVADTEGAQGQLDRIRGQVDGIPDAKSINTEAPGAETVSGQLDRIGVQVNSDNDKNIVITDNAPETIGRLESLGVKTETLPDGTIVIVDNASEVAAKIDRELNGKKTTGTHTIYTTEQITTQRTATGGGSGPVRMPDGTYRADGMVDVEKYAAGGTKLPDTAQIKSPTPRLIQWAEPETGGESFIPLAPSKRTRSLAILKETARRFGMSVIKREQSNIFEGDPSTLNDLNDPLGHRALLGGDYSGRMRRIGIEEDSDIVGAALSARKMLVKGDYDGFLTQFGYEEDSPLVGAMLDWHTNLKRYADGGVVDGMTAWVAGVSPGMQMTSGHRSSNDYHGKGMAADFSNGQGNTDEMLELANAIADNYPDSEELIYSDPRFTRNLKDGQVVDPSFYGADTMAQHTNHVHWARKTAPVPGDGAVLNPEGAGEDTRTDREKNIDAVISEGKRRNMSDKAIRIAVATMLTESDGENLANEADPDTLNYEHSGLGSDHDSSGVFQQRANGAWGTAADRMDPAKAAGMFYDELDKVDYENMDEGAAAQAVQKSAFPDAYANRLDEADKVIAESNARGNGGPTKATTSSGQGDPVYVTNWPSNFGSGTASTPRDTTPAAPSEPEPREREVFDLSTGAGRAGLAGRFFADGGIEDHQAQIGKPGDWRVWSEPETGGEGYIPLAGSKRPRSLAVLRQIANRFGFGLTPMSDGGLTGFGGHTGYQQKSLDMPLSLSGIAAMSGSAQRSMLQKMAALAVGGGFAAASGFDENGAFTGQFDTGANSHKGLEKGFQEWAEAQMDVLVRIAQAAENPDPVHVDVNVDQGDRTAELAIMKGGI